jgi:hypothetical protein
MLEPTGVTSHTAPLVSSCFRRGIEEFGWASDRRKAHQLDFGGMENLVSSYAAGITCPTLFY